MNNTGFASYTDDRKPLSIGSNIEDVIQRPQAISKSVSYWFSDNKMKANAEKCHFLCSSNQK